MFALMKSERSLLVSVSILTALAGPGWASDIIWVAGEGVGNDLSGDGSSVSP